MWLERTSAPAVEPLTLAEVKTYLRVDYTAEDALIAMLITSAVTALDGYAQGTLGRALITQSWRMYLDGFPSYPYTRTDMIRAENAAKAGVIVYPGYELGIYLPLPPLQTVDSIKYLDVDGIEQTLSTSVYTAHIQGQAGGLIRLNEGESWPSWRSETGCVRIVFTAGYGDAGSDVPAPIRHAMMMAIASAYDNRGTGNTQVTMEAYNNLLSPYRMIRG
jgi:hypothetical protein